MLAEVYKRKIRTVSKLKELLVECTSIIDMSYGQLSDIDGHLERELVTITYKGGSRQLVDVTCDSDIAVIKDIVNHIEM